HHHRSRSRSRRRRLRSTRAMVEFVRPPLPVVPIIFQPVTGKFRPQTGVEPPFDLSRIIRLGSKLPVEIFDWRSTVVENFDPS
ncbi:hypothetical protein TorRG33x02_289230, partial [Trema orientale]